MAIAARGNGKRRTRGLHFPHAAFYVMANFASERKSLYDGKLFTVYQDALAVDDVDA